MRRLALATASPDEEKLFFNLHGFAVQALLQKMMEVDAPFGRVLAGFAGRLSQTGPAERASIFSAAMVNQCLESPEAFGTYRPVFWVTLSGRSPAFPLPRQATPLRLELNQVADFRLTRCLITSKSLSATAAT